MELQESQNILTAINWTLTNLPALASIVYAIAFSAFLLYVYKRAGSMHFLRDRIWRLMGGKSDFYIPDLQKLKLEAREIEHFRFEFGVPARTILEIQQFESWIKTNNLSLKDIATAREYIDWGNYEKLKLKDKNLGKIEKAFTTLGITFLTLAALSFWAVTPNYLMASFDDSPYFYISTKETKLTIFGENNINRIICEDETALITISKNNEFPLQRIKVICEAYSDDKQLASLAKKIKEQRTAALSLSIFFALVMIYFARESAKVYAAQRLRENLKPEKQELPERPQKNQSPLV
ncbi:DUF6216 family protein [Pseudomonas sp.]|uniref:DUF6216 family protein n=1 Tax=Pseudomonas sp. TaxID=306 RepID=UPI002CA1036E|nr:DUF6216 family protein [Pseudomonas sp.]HUE92621.1 DUF6216 family protein [Pseudomonas sp.]